MEKENMFLYDENLSTKSQEEKVRKIMDLYHSGATKEATAAMIEHLNKYVTHLLRTKYATYAVNEFEDLQQCAYAGICEGMEKYDPDKGAPTTFFLIYITNELKNYLNIQVNKASDYYSGIIKKIKRIEAERGTKGLETTLDDLCILLKNEFSISTIKEAYGIINNQRNETAFPEFGEDSFAEISSYAETPEKKLVQIEETKMLYQCINQLTPIEKYVIILSGGLYCSDIELLRNILVNITQYSFFERLIANGLEPHEALGRMGFSLAEILMVYGLNKTKAIDTAVAIKNKTADAEIYEIFSDKEIREVVRKNAKNDKLKAILDAFGHTNSNAIISGKLCLEELKPLDELTERDMLRAKGFTPEDIELVLTMGKEMSGNKIVKLIPLEKVEIRTIETNAQKKLKKMLKNAFGERVRRNESGDILNQNDIPCTINNVKYIENFFENLDKIDDTFFDDDDESVEYEIIL